MFLYKMKSINSLVHILLLNLAFFFFSCSRISVDVGPPIDLVVSEGFINPIGFYNAEPTFSWKLPVAGNIKSQSAYRLVVASKPELLPNKADFWDSGKVKSDQSVWVNYKGVPLDSRQKVYWKVMFWDQNNNTSEWSEVARFELGLLTNSEWNAEWIGLPSQKKLEKTKAGFYFHRPQYLRKEFRLTDEIEQARLYITAKGVFEAQLNGQKVGNDIMTPGWTPFKKRIETLTYDVTNQIATGDNAIGIILAEGWHSGRIAYERSHREPKPIMRALCQLEVKYVNGSIETIYSDDSWQGTRNGPIRFAGIYDGEEYDANLEMQGWSKPGFDENGWESVVQEVVNPEVNLVPKRHAPVRDKMELEAQKITLPEPDKLIFDFGQNMVGVPMINLPVRKGQVLKIRFAEMLQQNGKLYTDNYREARSTDYYIPKENGFITWKPKFTFHGFRYVELTGFDSDAIPDRSWVKGIVQYSDFEDAGEFSSSDEKLNRLQSNIKWGLRGNFFDIPTDCPQRDERMGWTGDAQVFAPTSILNCNVHAFWASWLQSMREEQLADGGIPIVIPSNRSYKPSAGWSDAATIIPWEIYMRTGDKSILEENYRMMKDWVTYYKLAFKSREEKLKPLGDWLQPLSKNPVDDKMGETSIELIETAYLAHSINMTYKTAKVLGYPADATNLKVLRDSVRHVFENEFFDINGRLVTDFETQTAYLMALAFELVSKEMAEKIVPHLLRTIHQVDDHLRTGFLGTPLLAPTLDKFGQADLMYKILFKETYPSWFYSINQGATTMWERWNSYSHTEGFGDAGMNSFNHYAYGAIGQWFYEGIAGIIPLEPGYKRILIAPTPGKQLVFANAEYNSVYGKIESNWKKRGLGLELEVTIPPNTKAEVVIPVKQRMNLLMDEEEFEDNSNVRMIDKSANKITLDVLPGKYNFKTLQR